MAFDSTVDGDELIRFAGWVAEGSQRSWKAMMMATTMTTSTMQSLRASPLILRIPSVTSSRGSRSLPPARSSRCASVPQRSASFRCSYLSTGRVDCAIIASSLTSYLSVQCRDTVEELVKRVFVDEIRYLDGHDNDSAVRYTYNIRTNLFSSP